MANKRVVVTGAHSYLGQKLLQHLSEEGGYGITAFITPWADDKELFRSPGVEYSKVDLRDPLSKGAAQAVCDADRVLHFAWKRGNDDEVVLSENMKMFSTLTEHISSPEKLVFISSVAASPSTLSTYGKTKFRVANGLLTYGAIVLVTGLIVDKEPKGPYKLLDSVVKKLPIALRFTKNSVKVYPIRTEDFLEAIVAVLNTAVGSGSYRVYPKDPADINDFLSRLESKHKRFRIPLPVSHVLSMGSLILFRKIGVLPADLGEKLLTFLYKDDEYLATHADLPGTESIDRPLEEMI
jgi:nucleoside-diphosphate-sugar epimerase